MNGFGQYAGTCDIVRVQPKPVLDSAAVPSLPKTSSALIVQVTETSASAFSVLTYAKLTRRPGCRFWSFAQFSFVPNLAMRTLTSLIPTLRKRNLECQASECRGDRGRKGLGRDLHASPRRTYFRNSSGWRQVNAGRTRTPLRLCRMRRTLSHFGPAACLQAAPIQSSSDGQGLKEFVCSWQP
jgi:hypothetical protein